MSPPPLYISFSSLSTCTTATTPGSAPVETPGTTQSSAPPAATTEAPPAATTTQQPPAAVATEQPPTVAATTTEAVQPPPATTSETTAPAGMGRLSDLPILSFSRTLFPLFVSLSIPSASPLSWPQRRRLCNHPQPHQRQRPRRVLAHLLAHCLLGDSGLLRVFPVFPHSFSGLACFGVACCARACAETLEREAMLQRETSENAKLSFIPKCSRSLPQPLPRSPANASAWFWTRRKRRPPTYVALRIMCSALTSVCVSCTHHELPLRSMPASETLSPFCTLTLLPRKFSPLTSSARLYAVLRQVLSFIFLCSPRPFIVRPHMQFSFASHSARKLFCLT